MKLPLGIGSFIDFYIEPPAKAHEARNWALFGQWRRSDADEYQFWRIQSPCWVYPLSRTFRAFGVSYATLRGFSIAVALLGFVVGMCFLVRGLPRSVASAAALVWATDFCAISFDRSGLIEVMVCTFVGLTVLCLYLAHHDPRWLIASQVAFALAFFAKQGAIYIFPLLVIGNIAVAWKFWRCRDSTTNLGHTSIAWPICTAIALAIAAIWWITQAEYQRALQWNYHHMLFAKSELTHASRGELLVARVFSGGTYGRQIFGPFPILAPLALVGLVLACVRARVQRWTLWRIYAITWLVSACVAVVIARADSLRFSMILVMPFVAVAGIAMEEIAAYFRAGQRRRFAVTSLATLFVLWIAWHSFAYIRWVSDRRYDVVTFNRMVTDRIGERAAAIVGRFSAPMVLETPYDHFYVKWNFNTDPAIIRQLGITHAIIRDPAREELWIHLSPFWRQRDRHRVLGEGRFRRETLQLIEFERPIR